MNKGSLSRVETALAVLLKTIQDTGNFCLLRIVVDAFRQGGYLQVLKDSVAAWSAKSGSDDYDRELLTIIDRSLERRLLPGPRCYKTALSILREEIADSGQLASLLECRLYKADRQFHISATPPEEEILLAIRSAYESFLSTVSRITLKNMPYIVRSRDTCLSSHGSILLASQGLIIQMGAFADRLGLHKAFVAPGKSFAHIHSADLSDEPNWEFHYVHPGQKGSHIVGCYCCSMDEVNGDIVGIPANVAHGATNNGTMPLELNFCAGGRLPWNYPPQDLLNCSVENVVPTTDWSLVNGFLLESTLSGLAPGVHQLFDPASLGGRYGIELKTLILESGSLEIQGNGEVVHAWLGDGALAVAETDFMNYFSKGDKFALLADVVYIVKAVTPLKLLIFSMKDFH